MAGLIPDFTAAQRAQLGKLGVHEAQIRELQIAVAVSRLWLNQPAAKNDVGELLDEVAELSARLAQRLRALALQRDPAHATAHAYIEVAYWPKRPTDDGPTSGHHLCPRLDALGEAAQDAKASLPVGPTRFRAATPEPIGRIDTALHDGWRAAHGSGVRTSELPVSIPPRYPKKLNPSASPSSAFFNICSICYVAAGRGEEANPERAIKAYMRQVRKLRQEAISAFEEGLSKEGRERKRRTQRP